MKEVDFFMYLGMQVAENGRVEKELISKVGDGIKVFEALRGEGRKKMLIC